MDQQSLYGMWINKLMDVGFYGFFGFFRISVEFWWILVQHQLQTLIGNKKDNYKRSIEITSVLVFSIANSCEAVGFWGVDSQHLPETFANTLSDQGSGVS